VSHTAIMRWVFRCVPEYERRWKNRRAKPMGSPWRVDQTYIQTRPRAGDLCRAVAMHGKTVASPFQTRRGIVAAMAFFRKAVASSAPTVAQDHPG
jgi:transposase-like protein